MCRKNILFRFCIEVLKFKEIKMKENQIEKNSQNSDEIQSIDEDQDIDTGVSIIDKKLFESENFQKTLGIKKILTFCTRFSNGYLWCLGYIIICIAIYTYFGYQWFQKNHYLSDAFYASLILPVLGIITLVWSDIVLTVQTKKLKEHYPEKTKNLWILYLFGVILIIPSVVAAIITNPICKKILNELDDAESINKYK